MEHPPPSDTERGRAPRLLPPKARHRIPAAITIAVAAGAWVHAFFSLLEDSLERGYGDGPVLSTTEAAVATFWLRYGFYGTAAVCVLLLLVSARLRALAAADGPPEAF